MKPVLIQPTGTATKYLPEQFNKHEYDTLSAFNLPMNSTGTIAPHTTGTIALGYRIIVPRGCVGVIRERRTFVDKCACHVLAGIIDSNDIHEDAELKNVVHPKDDAKLPDIVQPPESTRFHPETVLYLHNCSSVPLEYKAGECWVQLFLSPIYESQLHYIDATATNGTPPPLRHDTPSVAPRPSLFSLFS